MQNPKPTRCFISKSINTEVKCDNEEQILNNIQEVSIHKNEILKAIMESYLCLDSGPTIFIDKTPYKIKLLERTPDRIELLQMYIKVFYKNNGGSWYKVINKRRVIVHF